MNTLKAAWKLAELFTRSQLSALLNINKQHMAIQVLKRLNRTVLKQIMPA
jgi:hypothetical protein